MLRLPSCRNYSIGDAINRPVKPPARWARACLTGGLVLITAVVIIQGKLTPAAADFGDAPSSAPPAGGATTDVQPTGGIGPAGDQPAIAGSPAALTSGEATTPTIESLSSTANADDRATASTANRDPAFGIPAGLDLPTLGVHADVHPVGIAAGQLEVPTDPGDVGWWTGSVPAGSPAGATIIDGHVDSAEFGVGALYRLTDLTMGDTVQVSVVGGGVVTYRVYERRSYDKETGLPAGIFGTDGTPRLVLITCGGTFDKDTGSYESNVAVFASPT